jgi:uncharacterized membrane protein
MSVYIRYQIIGKIMTEQKIINSEWEKVENWTSVKWGVIYFNHADTRTWVPKKITKM